MNTNSWIKETKIRLFGIKLYEKIEKCIEQNYEQEVIQVNISQDYYDKEFNINKNKRNENDNY